VKFGIIVNFFEIPPVEKLSQQDGKDKNNAERDKMVFAEKIFGINDKGA